MKTIGPSFVALQVRDLETSARFYTEELGLDRAAQSPPGAVVFATTPIPFALRVPSVDLSEVQHLGWGVALWLKADDPNALHAKLAVAGVTIVTSPIEGPFGLTFAFEDPDGYIITIHG
jgi:catechol 2,3-dioxygenase-like lactoylglutathione lyase family enzyme